MRRVTRFLGIFFMIGYVCSGAVAHAATYYVATNGSDLRSCSQAQSSSTARLTLNSALTCLKAGDTLYVRGGSYDESLLTNIYYNAGNGFPSGTSWSNKVRIAAYPGETVWLTPSSGSHVLFLQVDEHYVEFDGINMDGRNVTDGPVSVAMFGATQPHHIRIQNAQIIGRTDDSGAGWAQSPVELAAKTPTVTGGIELLNLTIHGGGRPGSTNPDNGYGIYVSAPNNLIEGCDIYDNKGAGIMLYNDDGAFPDNNIIRNNRIHDETRWGVSGQAQGICVCNGSNNQIYNNLIYDNSAGNSTWDAAIALSGSGYAQVDNNTLYGNSGWGIVVGTSTPGTIIRNNISYGNRLGNYADYGVGTYQSNNLFTDPRFNDPGGRDFGLRSDSPAIDQGAYLGDVLFDLLGNSRPQGNGFDIGAYESGGSAVSAPVVSPPVTPPPSGSGASPDATRIPDASSITDNSLAVWTIGSGREILRNGVQVAGGYGFEILWYQGTIYVVGDDSRYWRWTGSTWAFYGASDPSGGASASSDSSSSSSSSSSSPTASPSGTRVPSVSSLVDGALNVWTLGSSSEILRNGSQVVGGYGSQILWFQNTIYVRGDDLNWWRFTGVTWGTTDRALRPNHGTARFSSRSAPSFIR